jgi:hypothetical protein
LHVTANKQHRFIDRQAQDTRSLPEFIHLFLRSVLSNEMDWDDDAPPELVPTGTQLEPEEKPVKVPITLITGVFHGSHIPVA